MAGSDAQAGFYYQNIMAAQYALDLIEFGSQLRSIMLENPHRAEHIDDIIANRADGASFIQVKWSGDDTAAFTLHNLVTADDASAPLVAQLARGFREIAGEAGRKELILLSTKKAGTNRQPSRGFDKSLKEFLDELHTPFIAQAGLSDLRHVPSFAEYEPILDRLRCASDLADIEELARFLKCLRFRLNEPDRDIEAERVRARLARLGIEQAQYANLLDHIVRWSIESRLIRADDVLHALGLLDRFVDRLSHNFPVDRQVWVPTRDLFRDLDSSLDALDRGFILLEGEPGSGKSTALTMYRAHRADVLFGYYCFVPNDRTLGNERLQDDAFVRSICIGLRTAFSDVEFPRPYAPHTLDLLNDWLHVLSQQGRRVVFIVDGVDHVDRKTRQSLVAHPLTTVLDGDVPSNVLIVLSSQYLSALPPRLRDHVQSDARRHIQMSRFGRTQVRQFFQRRGVNVADDNLDAAVEASDGVPIYLEYLAECLGGMTLYEQGRFLARVPSLRDQRIDHYHQHLWDTCSQEQEVVYILAILAIRDEFTTREDLRDLLRVLGIDATMFLVEKAVERVRHVLRVSDARSIAIRHNSLREFIAERVRHLQQEINSALVTWYAQNPDRDEAWRHRFRHLFQLGEYSAVLAACDDEWLVRSWANHRPMHEIQQNLDIAWRAAAVQKDLVEYIRIALLKQRVALVARDLELSDAKIGRLLLDMGRPEEALRRVWNGERPQCGAIEFAVFVLHHAQCMGRVPPQHILETGLGERPTSASPQELRTWYRACAYARDPLELVSEIDGMHWRTKKYGHLRGRVGEDENRALNLSLQLAVVQELAERKDLKGLHHLRVSASLPDTVRIASQAAAALVLARVGETRNAATELEGLELSLIPAEIRHWFVLGLAACGIAVSPGAADSGYPELPTQFLRPMDSELDGQLFSLYDRLRVFFLRDETGYPWLEARTSSLSEPVKTLVRALGLLAYTWCSCVRQMGNTASRLAQLKEAAVAFDLDRRLFARLDHQAESSEYFYRQAAHRLYDAVWSCAAEHLSDVGLEELARWWVGSDGGRRGTVYPRATRKLAMTSYARLGSARNAVVRMLLELSERSARTDEETSVIVSEIIECASAWGRCGFAAEADRLWFELLNLGCGVYWRKDYQFNEILTPLKLAHEQDPGSTPKRLKEQFVLAHQLVGTARRQTIAAAIEGLIAFTARISPGLALSMLKREEPWIYRASALHRVILQLLQVQGIELRWVHALVATLGRWKDYTEYDEHTKPAMFAVYSSALHRHDYEVAQRAYDMARYVFLIEKECPSELGRWAAAWAEVGNAPSVVLLDLEEYGITQMPDVESSRNDLGTNEPGWTEDLDGLASRDLAALEERLDELSDESVLRERRRELERIYPDWRTAIRQAVGRALSEDDGQILDACFADLVAEICAIPAGPAPAAREATRAALRRFVESTAEHLDGTLPVQEFEQLFDVDAWLDGFVHGRTARSFHNRELEKRIQGWIEAAPLAKVHAWEDFCRRRCQGETKAIGFLAVGRRIAATEPQRAIDVLVDAWKSCSEFFYMHGPLAGEICSAVTRLDRERGYKLLFESFRQQYHRYPESIIYELDKLLDDSGDLPAFDAVRLYEIWSEHNRRLAAGLSAKPVDIGWLADDAGSHFYGHCLRYLLSLFDYPVVDVRRLALEQLFCLVREQPELAASIIDLWPELSSGQKEHVASLLFSLGIRNPSSVQDWAPPLVELAQRERHYNLRVRVAEAVCAGVEHGAELDLSLLAEARALKSAPRIVVVQPPSILAGLQNGARYPRYFRWLLGLLEDIAAPGVLEARTRAMLAKLYPQPDCGLEEEAAIHRRYNINTNFDVLEISADYDRAVREAVNLALYELVQEHAVDEAALEIAADFFRLYDPTDVLIRRVSRPGKITWIDRELSDEQFIRYADINSLKERIAQRDERWVSLYEHSEQRIGDQLKADPTRASKVRVTVFGVTHDSPSPTLQEIDEEAKKGALAPLRNRYRFELARMELESSQLLSGLRGRLVPVVQVSRSSFRGRHAPDLAAIVPELAKTLGLERHNNDLLGYAVGGQQVVRSIEWQEAFDQGRRLHEPRSSGFLLEMDRELLSRWADTRGVELWAYLVVERTTDRYKPESDMDWRVNADVFVLRMS